jgi:hypothetical protein
VRHIDGRATYGQTTTYPTKREAVRAVMSERAPKSAIVRVGHTYTITQDLS